MDQPAGIIAIMVLSLTFIFWGSFAIFKTMGFKGELELLLAHRGNALADAQHPHTGLGVSAG
jgi:hypothetical protein